MPAWSAIFGRKDGMVKLRGVNVFPEAVGAIVGGMPAPMASSCASSNAPEPDAHDEMTVLVETATALTARRLEAALLTRFREALGVKLLVKAVGSGEPTRSPGLSKTSKIKRVVDRRNRSSGHADLRLSLPLGDAQGLHLPHRARDGTAGQGLGHHAST